MSNDFDILFLAGLFPREKEDEIIRNSKGNIQNAANALQHGIASGLSANCPGQVRVLNSLYIGSFPKLYRKPFVKTYSFSHTEGANDVNVGYLNLVGAKRLSRYITLRPYIKKWIKERNDRKKVIIAYAATATFTRLLRYVKRLSNGVVTCLVVPDLPQFMNLAHRQSIIYKLLKGFEVRIIHTDTKYIDGFILLTEYMKDALRLKVPYVVVEGIATDTFSDILNISENQGIKTILYSGTLSEKYGVIDLVNAFLKLSNKDYRLVICGAGETDEYIIQKSKEDCRIIFKGLIKRDEVFKLQKSATILVNPRPNNEEYTKYSFPSKILEYMSSGTPVLSFRLAGIPDEYNSYYYTLEGDDTEIAILNGLRNTLAISEVELANYGKRAKEFVLREKSAIFQTRKIVDMINEEIIKMEGST